MTRKCLIVDEMHPSILPLLHSIGWEADYLPKITREEIIPAIGNYEGIIVRSKIKITREVLEHGVHLKFIARAGAGVDNIDEEEVKKRNILLINAPEGNRDAVAEHTVAMILTLLNRIHISDREVRRKVWNREGNRGYELKGKCVALIGYGYMGRAVARRLKAFDCHIIAFDKYLHDFSDEIVSEKTMEQVFEDADIVSLHIPLTSETNNLVNYNYLNRFKNNIWLVNTARGEILSLEGLIRSLKEGKVRGAALDVLENEKLQTLTEIQQQHFDFLINSGQVLLTPHVAGWTFESYARINDVLVEKIKAVGQG